MKKIKEFLVENGFVSIMVLLATVAAFILGKAVIAACLFGFFVGRNWEIIRKLYNAYLKEKLEDVVKDVKDKF